MSLWDEINNSRTAPTSNRLTEAEYQERLHVLYDKWILRPTKKYLMENRSERSFSYSVPFNDVINGERLFVFERKGSIGKNKCISLTPTGERVYRDLKQLAMKDKIVVGELEVTYSCEYLDLLGHKKTWKIHPRFGEWFAGKDPDHFTHSSGGYVMLTYSFTL